MDIDTRCPVCGRHSEDGGHLFSKCKVAKQTWNLLGLEERRKQLATQNTAVAAVSIMLGLKNQNDVLSVTLLWFLWANRNSIREEGRGRTAEELERAIRIYTNENSKGSKPGRAGNLPQRVRWKKPPEGFLKMNCDASFIGETKEGSWGFLIRDHEGDVVMSGRGKISKALSAFHAELITCMQGVQVASDMGIGNLILETDASEVRDAILCREFDARPEGGLIEEIRSFISLNFINFSCNFLGRSSNMAAHALASLGHSCIVGEALLASDVPESIAVIVADDLSEK